MFFEPNRGQAPAGVRWVARTADASVLAEDVGISVKRANAPVVRLRWIGTSKPSWSAADPTGGVTNYYLPHVRAVNVPQFGSVVARSLWDGVDLRMHAAGRQLQYDFHVAPEADVRSIRFRIEGSGTTLRKDGSLLAGSLQIQPPVAYQDGRAIPVRFVLNASGEIGFRVGQYHRSRPLVIDPVIVSLGYSTLIGGHGDDKVQAIRVNSQGEAFVTGWTNSIDFASGTAVRSSKDLFVAKLNVSGTAFAYLTFFGGSAEDEGTGLGIDAGGNALVGGWTSSTNISHVSPTQAVNAGGKDALIAKFSPTGQVVWSTYFGGAADDNGTAAVVDPADSSIVVVGHTRSANFPVSSGAWQTSLLTPLEENNRASFAARFNSSGARAFATFLSATDTTFTKANVEAARVALDSSSNILVSGVASAGLPVTPGYQNIGDFRVPFLVKLAANGSMPLFVRHFALFSFFYDSLAVDAAGKIYVAGDYNGIMPNGANTETIDCCGRHPTVLVFSADGKTIERQILPFQPRTESWFYFDVTAVALHPASDSVWIGGTGELNSLPATSGLSGSFPPALYRSSDNGSTWTAETLNGHLVREVVTGGSFRYALTGAAVYRQSLQGGAWVPVFDKMPLSLAVAQGSSNIYVSAISGLFRSTDGGSTWTAMTKPVTDSTRSGFLPYAMAAISGPTNTVLVSYYYNDFTTTNGGATWSTVQSNGVLAKLVAHPSAPVLYGSNSSSLARYSDGRWSTIDSSFDSVWTMDADNGDVVFILNGQVLRRSSDRGDTWAIRNNQAPPLKTLVAKGGVLTGANGSTIYRSSDGGTSWTEVASKAPVPVTALFSEGTTLFATTGSANRDAWMANVSLTTGEVRTLVPFGGPGLEKLVDIAIDSAGSAYAAGSTGEPADVPGTTAFPTSPGVVRTAAAGIDGFLVKVSTNVCTVATNPTSTTVAPTGGTGTIAVTATSCPWTAASGASWITLSGTVSGSGNATVGWTALPNPTSASRTGSVVVGGVTTVIEQAGSACSLGIGSVGQNVGSSAGSGTIVVSAALSYCTWQASTSTSWVTLGSAGGTGPGSLTYTYSANTTPFSRTAEIAVSGQTYTLTQAGLPCTVGLASASFNAPAAGALTAVPLNPMPQGCDVSATSNVGWIKPTAIGTYVGLQIGTNTGSARTGTVTVSGQTYAVNQAGSAGCTFTLDTSSANIEAVGRLNGVRVQLTASPDTCAWTAFSNTRWTQVYPLSGTGSRSIPISVLPNFSTAARTSVIEIAGRTFTIIQSGSTDTANQRFVRLVYFSALGRSASSEEVQFHVNSMSSLSRADVVNNFLASPEFALAGRFVAGAYVGLLNRDADYDGWQFQRNAIALGQTYRNVLTYSFLNSAEYASRFGKPSDEEFVRLLYRYILLREASASEVEFQVQHLPWQGRNNLAESFLRSEEFRIGTNSRMLAFLLSATLQMRNPTGAEQNARKTALDSETLFKTLIEQTLASADHLALLN